jgi:hypothetical protein
MHNPAVEQRFICKRNAAPQAVGRLVCLWQIKTLEATGLPVRLGRIKPHGPDITMRVLYTSCSE